MSSPLIINQKFKVSRQKNTVPIPPTWTGTLQELVFGISQRARKAKQCFPLTPHHTLLLSFGIKYLHML